MSDPIIWRVIAHALSVICTAAMFGAFCGAWINRESGWASIYGGITAFLVLTLTFPVADVLRALR